MKPRGWGQNEKKPGSREAPVLRFGGRPRVLKKGPKAWRQPPARRRAHRGQRRRRTSPKMFRIRRRADAAKGELEVGGDRFELGQGVGPGRNPDPKPDRASGGFLPSRRRGIQGISNLPRAPDRRLCACVKGFLSRIPPRISHRTEGRVAKGAVAMSSFVPIPREATRREKSGAEPEGVLCLGSWSCSNKAVDGQE